MNETAPVLVVGGTGHLGSLVVDELLARGKKVRALVRPGSNASKLESKGVEIARGDMLDLDSLVAAMTGADAVITTAAGYTGRNKNATEIDTIGNSNLAEAAHQAGVRRFVLTSILTSDQTPDVSHFWHKKLAEDKLEQLGVPFVALRPGAFLDQITQLGGDPFEKKRLMWFGTKTVPLTFVLTADLAGYLAAAVDAPGVDGQRIDIGWDRPVSMQNIADIATRLLGAKVKVRAVPTGPIRAIGAVAGPFLPLFKDMSAMLAWLGTGKYVADTTRQREVFGPVPTAEDALKRFITHLGHPTRDQT
ncbi:SDR family oxidoreductase [Kribbella caucasensis]|nr:SDR family oxidoreductase [Kribbella sp. VKM Ac-2527]